MISKKKGLHRNCKGFSGRNRKFKRFFRPITGDLQKKKGLHSKNVTKSGVSPRKILIWTSICAPEAPSLLISLGHSPRLGGGTIFVWGGTSSQLGGTAPVYPTVAPGLCTLLTTSPLANFIHPLTLIRYF